MDNKAVSKRMLLAMIVTTGLSFAITEAAVAQHHHHAREPTWCQGQERNPEKLEKLTAFMKETKSLRKLLAEKRAEMRAIMEAQNPDPALAGKVAGELFEVQEQVRVQAWEKGLSYPLFEHGSDGNMWHRSMHKRSVPECGTE
ncbi:MAG: hypothetical protein CSA33_07635 [Desulfobulbus propionicus]|nr:MAG: hypothetical protein CSA33_07635 [Desulfobulbus propionicus]